MNTSKKDLWNSAEQTTGAYIAKAEGVRRVKKLDRISVIILVIFAIVVAIQLPFQAPFDEEVVSNVLFMILTGVVLQSALMFRKGFRRMQQTGPVEARQDTNDTPFRGWRYTFFAPLATLVVLSPWIFSGAFNTEDMGTAATFFLLLFLFYIAWVLGFVALLLVLLPLELLARGLYGAIFNKGDKQAPVALFFGLVTGLLAATAFLIGFAITTDIPGVAAGPSIISALLGLPGSYEVNNEFLLWLARIATLAFILVLFIPSAIERSKRDAIKK